MKNQHGAEEVINEKEARRALRLGMFFHPKLYKSLMSLYRKGYIHIFTDGSISLREDKREEIKGILEWGDPVDQI